MPYFDIIWRSFRIAWEHKYLWLIAFFSGEAGGGVSFSYSQRTNQNTDVGTAQQQLTTWVGDHAGLLAVLGVAWLLLAIGLFILAAVCEGATVRAAAEHDAERPFGLRMAWTMGVHTMWVIVRFRLLLLLIYLPMLILVAAWLVALFVAVAGQNSAAVGPLVATGLFLLLVFVVYALYVYFLDRLGSRAVILEEKRAIPAIARANSLLFKRFGRSLVVWLLSVAVGLVVGVLLLCFSGIFALPLLVAIAATASNGSGAFWALLVVAVIVLLPIYVVSTGFLGAQSAAYWTLAFRRLDTDYPPSYAYAFPVVPSAPPPPPAPAQ